MKSNQLLSTLHNWLDIKSLYDNKKVTTKHYTNSEIVLILHF